MDDTSAEPRRVAEAHTPTTDGPGGESPFGGGRLGDPRMPAVLYLILGAGGAALLAPVLAAFPGTDRDYLAATASTAAGWAQLVGGLALAGSGVALAVTVTRLTRIAQSVAGGDSGAVARAAATAHAAMIGVASAALSANALVRLFDGAVHTDPAALPRLGFVLLTIPGMVAASVTVFGTTFAGWRAGRLGTLNALFGFAIAALVLAGVLLVPVALLPAWLIATAFTIRRR